MKQISNNVIRQILLLATIVVIGIIIFYELKIFIPAFLGAYTLFVLLRKYMFKLEDRKWNKSLSAALLMFISFIVILLPISLVINMLSQKISFAVNHSNEILGRLQNFIQEQEQRYDISILNTNTFNKITSFGTENLPKLLGATFNSLTTVVVMYFILFFLLVDGRNLERRLYRWMPLKETNVKLLRRDVNLLVNSNAIGIPLIALAQGVVGLIGYLVLGVKEPMFWFVITCITAMLPVVGAAIAYIPLGIIFIANGLPLKGIIMLLYGFLVIGTIDNVLRFWLQKKLGDVHPIITVFGVIIGINMFGFIGLVFGPILISLFLLLIKVYVNEFNVNTNIPENQ